MKMQITLFTLGALATALSMTPAVEASAHNHPHHHKSRMIEKRSYSGKATFYNTETGNAGSCGDMLSNNDYTVALNAVQYNSGWCGKTITISANGKTHSATIKDECPGDGETCKYGALDMSPALFNYFADPSVGVIDMTWSLGGAVESVVSSLTGGNKDDDSSSNKKSSSNQDNNDDEEEKKKAAASEAAASQAAASKEAAQASRSSASAAAYASSTAAAAASASRASVSSAAYASSTHAAAISSSKASVAAEKSESRASVSSESRASVSASKSSASVAAASASAEAARPKNLENFDALFGGLQQLAMAAQS